MDDHRKAFGRRIRELRHERGLTQEALAERAGMHWTYISAVERGLRNVSLDSIARLAQGLQVSWATLFSPFTRRFRSVTRIPVRKKTSRPPR